MSWTYRRYKICNVFTSDVIMMYIKIIYIYIYSTVVYSLTLLIWSLTVSNTLIFQPWQGNYIKKIAGKLYYRPYTLLICLFTYYIYRAAQMYIFIGSTLIQICIWIPLALKRWYKLIWIQPSTQKCIRIVWKKMLEILLLYRNNAGRIR